MTTRSFVQPTISGWYCALIMKLFQRSTKLKSSLEICLQYNICENWNKTWHIIFVFQFCKKFCRLEYWVRGRANIMRPALADINILISCNCKVGRHTVWSDDRDDDGRWLMSENSMLDLDLRKIQMPHIQSQTKHPQPRRSSLLHFLSCFNQNSWMSIWPSFIKMCALKFWLQVINRLITFLRAPIIDKPRGN